jgi:hypothetical protein
MAALIRQSDFIGFMTLPPARDRRATIAKPPLVSG